MKKLWIAALAVAFSGSTLANGQIPKQFHGCWGTLVYGEIPVTLEISAKRVTQASEGGYYVGNVKSVKGSGNSYTIKTKGDMDGSPFSLDYKLKLNSKSLNVSGDKFTKC